MESQNFTYSTTLSAIVTQELNNLKAQNFSDDITTVLIVDRLKEKHKEVRHYLSKGGNNRRYFRIRVRNVLNQLSNSNLLQREKKQTALKTTYYNYKINF